MINSTVETALFDEALKLGFASLGIAQADDAVGRDVFDQWLSNGYAGSMNYLGRHAALRRHPAAICPPVRSVIAVIARYPTNPSPQAGGFSMLARTADYHDVLRNKLRQLTAVLTQVADAKRARICIDSAPLPEREWAQRAGLGWQGKQGQLVSPVAGTCTVLGFILTDCELTPSETIANQCGTCNRCVVSCPSGAILPDSQIDARRCTAYLTIEHEGLIEKKRQQALGQALFGCDICTSICPWNLRATAPVMPELKPHTHRMPTTGELLTMSAQTFANRFKGTVVKRTGLERLQRNATIAQYNQSNTIHSTPDEPIDADV